MYALLTDGALLCSILTIMITAECFFEGINNKPFFHQIEKTITGCHIIPSSAGYHLFFSLSIVLVRVHIQSEMSGAHLTVAGITHDQPVSVHLPSH